MKFFRPPWMKTGEKVVFQGFWHGEPLGELRMACVNSFLRLGYDFDLYTYKSFKVPNGVIVRDASEIIPLEELFYFKNPETNSDDLGPFSDLFRFKLLSERGGWWIDVDTICLSRNIPSVQRAWAQQLPEVSSMMIGTGQIAMAKGDPLAIELYRRCLALSQTSYSREDLGPRLLSTLIKEYSLPKNLVGEAHTFYPLRFIETFKLWMPEFHDEVIKKTTGAMFLPIFQSFPQYIGLTSSKLPPEGSYLGEFCRLYFNDYGRRSKYKDSEIRNGTIEYLKRNSSWALNELKAVSGDATLKKLGINPAP